MPAAVAAPAPSSPVTARSALATSARISSTSSPEMGCSRQRQCRRLDASAGDTASGDPGASGPPGCAWRESAGCASQARRRLQGARASGSK
jgi:hypothetical protein